MGPHALMFHYFHGGIHADSQGSLSAENFDALLTNYKKNWNVINASEWQHKSATDTLEEKDVCLSFDDGLRSQFDVALPILEKHNLNAFWFIYSAPLVGVVEPREFYRYCQWKLFNTVEDFYAAFLAKAKEGRFSKEIEEALKTFDPATYLSEFTFYTTEDRLFRYVRNEILGMDGYIEILESLFALHNIDVHEHWNTIWLNKEAIKELHTAGHTIGLHSHTHPLEMNRLSREDQEKEFQTNKQILENITKGVISAMSHPRNSYNEDTLAILKKLNITLGFRANMAQETYSKLEYPREDPANIA